MERDCFSNGVNDGIRIQKNLIIGNKKGSTQGAENGASQSRD
jgi:hypothetical protein